ncbi:MAG: DUF1190 domain-containing protein [Glaciecola sp.]
MSKSKRSQFINLAAMRKTVSIKPLAFGAATLMLGACSSQNEEASIYIDANDCSNTNPNFNALCETTYQQALEEAEDTGPKYNTLNDCEYDFGANQCAEEEGFFGNYYMPLMAGYMVGNMLGGSKRYTPMYTSKSRFSPLKGRWFTADGMDVGDYDVDFKKKKKYKVKRGFFAKRPTTTSTIRRGGFGNIARATASRTRSSSKGWGG